MAVVELVREEVGAAPDGDRPVRFRRVERDDALAIGGAAVAATALAWLICTRLTAAGTNLGMFVVGYLLFLVLVWAIGREQYDAVRARDFVARVLFWSAGLLIAVPMIAISVYVLVAIVRKRLNLSASLYEILQILSLTMFERTPLDQLLTLSVTEPIMLNSANQLNLFE